MKKTISIRDNSLRSWNDLLRSVMQQNQKVMVEIHSSDPIDPEIRCLVLHMRDACLGDNHEIRLCSENIEGQRELEILLASRANTGSLPIEGVVYISPVKDEATLFNYKQLMLSYIIRQFPFVKQLDTSPLEVLFAEAYQNIIQHAKANSGYIYIYPSNIDTGEVIFLVSDTGKGIPFNIASYYHDKKNMDDASLIEEASKDGVTTKSRINNAGKGIPNMISQAIGLSGFVEVYSGSGHCAWHEPSPVKTSLDYEFVGTLYKITLYLHQLEPLTEQTYTDDVDF